MPRLTKLFLVLTILTLLSFAAPSVNADTLIIGSGDSLSRYPVGLEPGVDSTAFPNFAAGGIYQQVYANTAFPGGPITITQIAFASKGQLTSGPGLATYNFNIGLSTTAAVPGNLSTNLAVNRGADFAPVFSGQLTAALTANNQFDLIINITPFTYNPANGNLLLEIGFNAPVQFTGGQVLYFNAGSIASTNRAANPGGTGSAFTDSLGLQTRFTTRGTAQVTLGNLDQTFDGSPKSVAVTSNPPGLDVVVTYDGNATPPSNAGSYAVAAIVNDPNFTGQANGNLIISKAGQQIAFDPLPNKTLADPDFSVSATASSNLVVSFAVSGACTLNGNQVHLTGAGACTITATQEGNANINAATPVARTFSIDKSNQQITFEALADKEFGDADFQISATASSNLAISFAASGNCTVSGSQVHLAGAGLCTITASQGGNENINAAPDVTRSFTINKANQTITFDALSPGTFGDSPFTASATGGASGNPIAFSSQTPAVCSMSSSTVTILSAGTCTIRASQAGDSNYDAAPDVDQSFTVSKATPVITWSNPSDITYGTQLGATQLNATADVPGSFAYTPSPGTLLASGNDRTLHVDFTPTDAANYNSASKTVKINVLKATLNVSWDNPADITYGTVLSATQLNATAPVPGNFAYTPAAGTTFNAGNNQTLSVDFTPTDANNYNTATKSVAINVLKATPTITWSNPSSITFGTALSITQLNATASTPGALTYNPVAGTVLNAGSNQTLSVDFAPTDTANYNAASKSVQINVGLADQTITFGALSNKTFGDVPVDLSATASSGLAVSFELISGPATLNGNQLTISGAGHVVVRAIQSGNDNYNAATPVLSEFDVLSANSIITLSNLAVTYDGSAKFATAQTNPAGLKVNISYSQGGVPVASPTNAGSYDVAATIDDANYQGSVTDTLVINKAESIITWSDPSSIVQGTLLGNSQLNATANVPGTFTYNPPGGATLDVGSDQVLTVSFTPTDTLNYLAATKSVKITVTTIPKPLVKLSTANYSVKEGDASGVAEITVTRIGDETAAFTVDYTTGDQSGITPCQNNNGDIASERCDYVTAVGTLRFAAGETTKTIKIPITDDAYTEAGEKFTITLRNPHGADLDTLSTATVTIEDNDAQAATQNPIDDQGFFIQQQYEDFLGRVAEDAGFQFWMNRMNNCPQGQTCDRIDTSQRFFQSDEFQERGFYVYRLYDALLSRLPRYAEFVPEVARLNGSQTVQEQRLGKDAYLLDFINTQEFRAIYGQYLSANGLQATNAEGFVNELCARAGIAPASRQDLINNLQSGAKDPAHTLEDFILTAEISGVGTRFYDRGFITMQYFGYLRRDPETAGFNFWVGQLIGENAPHRQDYRFMVGGFLQSDEYRFRFALLSTAP